MVMPSTRTPSEATPAMLLKSVGVPAAAADQRARPTGSVLDQYAPPAEAYRSPSAAQSPGSLPASVGYELT